MGDYVNEETNARQPAEQSIYVYSGGFETKNRVSEI